MYTKYDFLSHWTGITLVLEPTTRFETQREEGSSYKRFLGLVLPHRRILLEIFVASLLLNVFGLATPLFTQNVVDKVLGF